MLDEQPALAVPDKYEVLAKLAWTRRQRRSYSPRSRLLAGLGDRPWSLASILIVLLGQAQAGLAAIYRDTRRPFTVVIYRSLDLDAF